MALVLNGSGITSANIADGTIAVSDVADNAITEAKIADAAVVSLKSGRKNLIINGGFDVWQRGTSGTTNGYSAADRWYVNQSGGSTTFSQQSFTSGQTEVPDNPKYFGRLTVSTGNDNCGFQLRLEDHTLLANRDVTFSFWAKSATPRILRVTAQSFGSTVSVTSDAQTFTPTSAWVKYSFTFNIGSVATVSGTTLLTRMSINQGSDTSTAAWELDLANVQLEVGSVATDFEHRSYGEELALCQRYYEKGTNVAADGYGKVGTVDSGAYAYIPFKAEKRVNPSLAITRTLAGSPAGYGSGIRSQSDTGFGYWYRHGGTTGPGNLEFNISLWTADAEL
ncbi:MAG: carbohydrate binding domain-containing protein [Actinomycetia bacterium]|nr:carbohydrate binding domain-containing protein [Actinomycetes bacterium]